MSNSPLSLTRIHIHTITFTHTLTSSTVLSPLYLPSYRYTVTRRVQSALSRANGSRGSISAAIQRIFMTYLQMMSILSASKMKPPDEVTQITASTSSFTDGISASAFPIQCAVRWGF